MAKVAEEDGVKVAEERGVVVVEEEVSGVRLVEEAEVGAEAVEGEAEDVKAAKYRNHRRAFIKKARDGLWIVNDAERVN